MSNPLDIRLGEERVGVLAWHERQYVYASRSEIPATAAPNLTDIQRSRIGDVLPPFLEVSMPEGNMRQAMLTRLGRSIEPDDMRLLRAVGGNMIGLLLALDDGKGASALSGPVQLGIASTLHMNERQLLDLAFAHVGRWPGISGGFMKLLVTTHPEPPHGRSRHWIVKLADLDRPGLCAIEHFGMLAASSMGLEVPKTILSDDCSRLLVERFDVDVLGGRLGFADMCSLGGEAAADKYASSTERVVGLLAATCDPETVMASKEAFFAQYLLASVIRNGDAHLKNFGVLYGHERSVVLSPVYDMVSMAVYAPKRNDGDAADGMALTLGGSRRWPSPQMLSELARRCSVSRTRELRWQKRLEMALIHVGRRAASWVSQYDSGRDVRTKVARMIELWGIGIRPYSFSASDGLSEIAQTLMRR